MSIKGEAIGVPSCERKETLTNVAGDRLAKLQEVIRTHDILRLKGFLRLSGKPMRLTVQAVGPRIDSYFDGPVTGPSRLVVIGQAGLDQAAISAALGA